LNENRLFPATGKKLQLTPPTVILKPVDKKTTGALEAGGDCPAKRRDPDARFC
jgi:hypothetical protein